MGAELTALGLDDDLSAGSNYAGPKLWARAIHAADPKWDRSRYVSRQRNDATAVAVFERSGLRKHGARPLGGRTLDPLLDLFRIDVFRDRRPRRRA